MKKRLLLLLCLLATAGSAAWADIAQGTFKNGGTWTISNHILYVEADEIPDYQGGYSGCAPWCRYRTVKSVELKGVKKIGQYAFWHMESITNVYFSNKTQADVEIGYGAFVGCYSLQGFDARYIKKIGDCAFWGCINLERLVLPSVEEIGKDAFEDCYKLIKRLDGDSPSIWLTGNTIPTIKEQHFEWCDKNYTSLAYNSVWKDENGNILKKYPVSIPSSYHRLIIAVPNSSLLSSLNAKVQSYPKIMPVIGGPITSTDEYVNYYWFLRQNSERLVIYSPSIMDDYTSASATPWYAYRSQIKYIDLANSQDQTIGKNAFSELSNVKYVYYDGESRITKIGESAFANCTNLENIEFAKIAQVIDKNAFAGCSKVNSKLFIPAATTIGDAAFDGCHFNGITFGDKLTSIGQNAFRGSFASGGDIYVFTSVPTTSANSFSGADMANTTLHVSGEYWSAYTTTAPWSSFLLDKSQIFPVGGLIVNGSGSWELNEKGELCIHGNTPNYGSVREQPWYQYRELIQKIIIDDGWGIIGDYSFAFDDPAYCHVTDYKLPAELKKVGKHAFENNYLLKEVSIENMEEVDDYAFAGCTLLRHAYFGKNSAKFGKNVFDGCENFDEMSLTAATPPEVTAETFKGMGSSSSSQGARRRAAGTGQKSVTLDVPDEYLTKYLANPYWRLFSFYTGEYGRIVGSGDFGDGLWILYDNGTMVVSADKGPGNTYAEGSAQALGFGSSSDSSSPINLTKRVEFLGNITHLGWGFQNFPNLESVQLCPSIMRLDDTFEGCPKLTDINLENVDTIGDWTFARSGVKDIQLPRVSYIGRGAFYKCQQLQTVSLGTTCEIREQAFFYCDKMTDINLADAQLDGASQCFSSCYKLKNVTFSGTYLPSKIFSNCFDLASIDLGSRVDSISFDAFYGCNALNTVYCANPTPPAMPWGKRKVGDEYYDAQAFFGRNLQNIHLYLPASIVLPYRKADVWKGMTIETDLRYTEDLLPTGGSIGDKGTWHIDTDGTLTLDFEGYAWSNDLGGVKWHDLLAPWVPFLTRVVISDRVNWVPTDMTGEHNPEWSADVTSVELGSHVTEVNSGSLNYSGLRDVYCYAESCPIVRETGFDWEALTANNATLHVVTSEGVLGRYQNSRMWSRFPNIVADLPSRLPAGVFHTTTAEGLELWFRVTDEEAKTCETFVNDLAGCAVENNPYTQYDRLTIPATAQYNGTAYTVTAIGDNSFYGCTNFATFILPETIERIGVNAFNYCFSVHEFTLPASVKYIGEYAFEMWVNIERLTVNGQVPPAVSDDFINTYWDPDLRPKPVLLVPEGCRDAWNVAPWNEWFNVYDPYNKSMLVYKVKPGTEFYNYYQNDEEYMCIEGLKALELIHFENELVDKVWDPDAYFWEEVWGDVYYNKAGKKLFYIDDESCIQIFEGVGPADNIYYEFKADDYETMMYTTGRNVDLYKGAAIIFPESNVQTDIYFTATNADGIDISYRVLDLSKKTCEVKADPNGYGSNAVSSDVSDVKVPFEAGGYVVTGIAADAFNSMSGLQVVTLPASIRNIGANAFGYCENVVAVYMESAAPPMLLDQDGFLTAENNMAFESIGVPAGTEMGGAMLYVPYGSEEAYDVYPWNYWFGSSIQTDPDGIKSLTPALSEGEGVWYDLSGRKLGDKPAKSGLYIHNGKKVVIK